MFRPGLAAWVLLVFLAPAMLTGVARAAALSDQAKTPRVDAKLVSALAVASPGGTIPVALHQSIIDGWHTYWKNPGDSGESIDISWTLPENVDAGELRYPVPEAIPVGPLMNYGYADEVTLLTDIEIPGDWPSGEPVPLEAHATWLVCEETCIPEEARFSLSLPTGDLPMENASAASLFRAARERLPLAAPWPVSVNDNGNYLSLSVSGLSAAGDRAAYFFPATWGHLAHSGKQKMRVSGDRLELDLPKGELPPRNAIEGILTIGGAGYLVSAPIAAGVSTADSPGVIMLLLLAFAGGVLLNLMPCVFPVLAIKAMSLLNHASLSWRPRAAGGMAYLLGVLFSFLVLVGILLAFRAGGTAVGWGFHLQNPAVVAALALVLFAVGLSLSGLIVLSGSWTGAGSDLADRPGLSGSFFTGVLAAVVATPCTAPFMATAIGVAMLQSTPVAISVFLALGAGLAAPYLLLTLIPTLARALPKPGPWMEKFRQLLAFPMYAAAAWLLWVLAQQSGANAVGLAALAMVALALSAWAWKIADWRGLAVTALAASLACVAVAGLQGQQSGVGLPAADATAEPYDPDRLDNILSEGGAVFVNVTAAWCVTCKVNEQLALTGERFEGALAQYGVTYMKADWTSRDPEITALLSRFGRIGVPLYVVFPRRGQPRVLPQVLTGSIVAEALGST